MIALTDFNKGQIIGTVGALVGYILAFVLYVLISERRRKR